LDVAITVPVERSYSTIRTGFRCFNNNCFQFPIHTVTRHGLHGDEPCDYGAAGRNGILNRPLVLVISSQRMFPTFLCIASKA
jgi:hypothetical protein